MHSAQAPPEPPWYAKHVEKWAKTESALDKAVLLLTMGTMFKLQGFTAGDWHRAANAIYIQNNMWSILAEVVKEACLDMLQQLQVAGQRRCALGLLLECAEKGVMAKKTSERTAQVAPPE